MDKLSFTSASTMPIKLLQCKEAIVEHNIVPYHIQLIPTNRCNANCPWCSCKGVDRQLELPVEEIIEILHYFKKLGTKAITITGGGEPSLHKFINNILVVCHRLDIDIGVVSNGIIWSEKNFEVVNDYATWSRISITDTIGDYPMERVQKYADNLKNVEVGVSFTVTDQVNLKTARAVCELAESQHNMTHIRFVEDILNACPASMAEVEAACAFSSKAIFQGRSAFATGQKHCHISKLKPVINADGNIFPCCGVQYATDDLKKMPKACSMGHWSTFHTMPIFDGRVCKKCYYSDYNKALELMTTPVKHERFL